MIVTRTPFRITLGGGGTDLPSFYREHGGFILAVAIDKYMYLNVNTPILDDLIRVRYSKAETVRCLEEIEHPLARAALEHFSLQDGIEIVSIADIPAGTGVGSSSCYLVGLLNALHALTQTPASPQQLAEEACHIELDLLHKPIGKQDQFMAAYGGLTRLEIAKDGKVEAQYLSMPLDVIEELESNLLRFGELMDQHWQAKKRLSTGITNSMIDGWYELSKRNGAIGGKISGAGGGGFLMLYCEESKAQLREALRHAGL